MPDRSEIAPLLIVIKLEQYDYAGAAAMGLAMLVDLFVALLAINLLQVVWTAEGRVSRPHARRPQSLRRGYRARGGSPRRSADRCWSLLAGCSSSSRAALREAARGRFSRDLRRSGRHGGDPADAAGLGVVRAR